MNSKFKIKNFSKGFTMMKNSKNSFVLILNHGFTMIELLVVISIIGVLAALSLVSFTTSQKQARDSARKSDTRQYQTTLESFASKNNGFYPARPVAGGVVAESVLCADLDLTNCPADPKANDTTGTYVYKYQSDGSDSTGEGSAAKYVLWDRLENSSEYWVICSNGKAGVIDASSWVVPSDGVCPI